MFKLLAPIAGAAAWQMYGYDAQNTGYAPYPAPSNGTIRWSFEMEAQVVSTAVYSPDGATAYMACDRPGVLRAFDVATGQVQWEYRKPYFLNMRTTPVVDEDGNLYFGTTDCLLNALDSQGNELWTKNVTTGYITTPTMDNNGHLYIASQDKFVAAYNSQDGSELWVTHLDVAYPGFQSTPALSHDGSMLYVGSTGKIFALDTSTGSQVWVTEFPDQSFWLAPPTLTDAGVLMITTYSFGQVLGLNASSGEPVWVLNADNSLSAIAIYNNMGVLPCYDGNVYAFDVTTGALQWKTRISPPQLPSFFIESSPTIAGDGTIFVGSEAGMHSLSSTGELLWTLRISDYVQSSPSISPGGAIVFGSLNRFVYAL